MSRHCTHPQPHADRSGLSCRLPCLLCVVLSSDRRFYSRQFAVQLAVYLIAPKAPLVSMHVYCRGRVLWTRARPRRISGRQDGPIASVIERGWQGNYFLGVGDVRARPTGVGSEVTQSAPTASGQPINALRFLSSGRYVHVNINACARVDAMCRRQFRPGPATPGAVIATTLANTSTWRTWTSRQYVSDENWRSQRDCH